MIVKLVQVSRIIFRNEENGYQVLEVFSDADGIFIAKGYFPTIAEGSFLSLKGNYIENPKYGLQFDVKEVYIETPSDKQGIFDYLTSGLVKGVGPVTAEALIKKFGLKTLEIIEKNPKALEQVQGIGPATAAKIVESHNQYYNMQELISFCMKYGIPNSRAIKIFNFYGKKSIDKIKDNPYQLIEDISGIGFAKADEMALALGLNRESHERIAAAIFYVLSEAAANSGHTCLPLSVLVDSSINLLGFDKDFCIQDNIDTLIETRKIYKTIQQLDGNDTNMIASAMNYHTELGIYNHTKRLINAKTKMESYELKASKEQGLSAANLILTILKEKDRTNNKNKDDSNLEGETADSISDKLNVKASIYEITKEFIVDEIDKFEKSQDVVFDETQKQAILNSFLHGISIITGGPGTGKTTIIDCIVHICLLKGLDVELGAPTGRASKRLSEATGQDARTIHRLLGATMEDGSLKFKKNNKNKLGADMIIIDEVSMADIYIYYSLIQAIKTGARLILVGDKDQLPSVSAGNILSDYIESDKISVTFLTKIYRQDEKSLIVYNAHKINEGKMPIIDNNSNDFFFEYLSNPLEIVESIKTLYLGRIEKHFGIRRDEIQILCPVKKGQIGTENLNKVLQEELIPQVDKKLAVGDKVMHIVNNYDIDWIDDKGIEGKGIFNGEVGFVKEVDARSNLIVTFEDGKTAKYSTNMQNELMLAYAISVHKSQGSEFRGVILVVGDTRMPLYNRNLLYTAITRAREMVIIVGTQKTIYYMVNNSYTENRYTHLLSLLKE